MAISKAFINGSASALAEFLDGSGLFGSVAEAEGVVTCYDEDDNPVYVFTNIEGNRLSIQVYYNNGASSTYNNWSGYDTKVAYAYKCANGVLINVYSVYGWTYGAVLLTKTNSGKNCIVFSSNLAQDASIYTSFKAMAYDDAEPSPAMSFSNLAANQTQLVPFPTNCPFGAQSFTPNAGYMPVGQCYSMGYGKILLSEAEYVTNGYWAIRDSTESCAVPHA